MPNWGSAGVRSQGSVSRVTGLTFLLDVYFTGSGGDSRGGVVGFHDGVSSVDETHFSHGLLFGYAGALKIMENGNDRGMVGSGWSIKTLYRVRITIAGNAATYEIQGGAYGILGGASWTTLTPGTSSSSSTTPLYAAIHLYDHTMYAGDCRIYG